MSSRIRSPVSSYTTESGLLVEDVDGWSSFPASVLVQSTRWSVAPVKSDALQPLNLLELCSYRSCIYKLFPVNNWSFEHEFAGLC